MSKIAATLRGIHNITSLQSAGIRSIPLSSKSAFLDLFALQTRRERLLQEKTGLKLRRDYITKELSTIKRNMASNLKIALKAMDQDAGDGSAVKSHGRSMVLSY